MQRKGLPDTDAVQRYVLDHSRALARHHLELIAETERLYPDRLSFQIPPEQGLLLGMLVRLTGASRVLEIGTFTGLSALFVAEALPPGGRLLCLDISPAYTAVARRHWDAAGVGDRIELRLGPAAGSLAALTADDTFDLVFLDADKEGYIDYYRAVLPRLRPGGLIVADNTMWHGDVALPEPGGPTLDAVRAFNDHVAADPLVEVVIVPAFDGLSFIRPVAS
jgi:caffeoyl-CoA O-methyltransferase